MNNYLLSAAIGAIAAGSFHEPSQRAMRSAVKRSSSDVHITNNTICTFACAEALINDLDINANLYQRGEQQESTSFRYRLKKCFGFPYHLPFTNCGIGSAIRCTAAGWLATDKEECEIWAKKIASTSSLDPDMTKSAVLTASSCLIMVAIRSSSGRRSSINTIVNGCTNHIGTTMM